MAGGVEIDASEIMRELDRVQAQLDKINGWDLNSEVENVLMQMQLDGEADFEKLSGGQKRRALLAKAALNMLTYTSASDLANYGIFMNAVDTGWVTDEDPMALSQRKQQMHDFQPPLDIVLGVARVCDRFFHGILTGKHWCGNFLKDYFSVDRQELLIILAADIY